MKALRIGTAGWAIPRTVAERFPAEGTGLARYAARFDAVEINSTFYRPHRPQTFARWVETTPPGFRFAVKAPRAITHEARLVDAEAPLAAFAGDVAALGDKLGPLLVQLPPSLAFDAGLAERFFTVVANVWSAACVCEPRHASWFEAEADALLRAYRIGRVAADPARHPLAAEPGGDPSLAYWRLHGSPRIYYSSYDDVWLAALAAKLRVSQAAQTWCIFDNTTSGAAAANALALVETLR
ncbi:MAG: hypothetical protein JWO33_1385 [Caulobacteraceae bacterium]|nr:hypothetical protein [Caulobacteraceae bacterium]